ncbi:alkaline phosphatase D family protein [Ekhidna sp.]
MKKYLLFICILPSYLLAQKADVIKDAEIMRIAFGSCSVSSLTDKQLWAEVNETKPDLWIWLGDNIYGDSEDVNVLRSKYAEQKSHPDYQKLLTETEVIGTWDDHDFGVNDGGKEFKSKDGSKEELFRFLNVAQDHPARSRKGVYQSYTYNHTKGSIKIILLDTRYFRDSLKWENEGTRDKAALVNSNGDVLGETQWSWLENQLSEPGIDMFIVVTGIQLIPDQHQFEKWSNFPKSKDRLMKLVDEKVNVPLVFLSGDRHISEVSKEMLKRSKEPIYEFTSSSLTSPWGTQVPELNDKRIGKIVYDPNFAIMTIVWTSSKPSIQVKYIGKENEELAQHSIKYD